MSEPERQGGASKALQLTAKIGISCQFAALVRMLVELLWIDGASVGELAAGRIHVHLIGALVAAVLCWVAVFALWLNRVRFAIAVAAATIVILLALKAWAVHSGLM